MGSLTEHPSPTGFCIFLHGWEGSQDSTYVLSSARFAFEKSCSVFRLNFRDHGPTHHLNEELFHSARLDEVFNAVRRAADMAGSLPVYLIGFSLGGNFALRIVEACKANPIPNLAHVFSISPVIDPLASSAVIDKNPVIQRYFYKKWTTSIKKKQAAFPGLYDFSDVLKAKTVMELSEKFVPEYSEYETAADYFNAYGVGVDDLIDTNVRTSIIMSKDDPVLRADDIMSLNLSPCVSRIMLKYGGHNGFFNSLHGPTWYDDYMGSFFEVSRQ